MKLCSLLSTMDLKEAPGAFSGKLFLPPCITPFNGFKPLIKMSTSILISDGNATHNFLFLLNQNHFNAVKLKH